MAHELTDWYEEAERLRVERDALTARLVERDAEIAALREAARDMRDALSGVLSLTVVLPLALENAMRPIHESIAEIGRRAHPPLRYHRALLDAVPAPPTAAPHAAGEEEGE
jgi:uncharacterized coiled-coil DUF342 family protein